jgi:hypothetical protein
MLERGESNRVLTYMVQRTTQVDRGASRLGRIHLRGAAAWSAAWSAAVAILVAQFAVSISPAMAQTDGEIPLINREYSIKAVFLYHFSTYTEWPEGKHPASGEPFVIGVFPTDPFGAVLDQIAQTRRVEDHPIVIRRLSSLEGVKECHILFLRRSVKAEELNAVLKAVHGASVLVVGETEGFAEQGGMVEFFVEGNKVRFIINVKMTRFEDLKVSSKLLSLARIVPEP